MATLTNPKIRNPPDSSGAEQHCLAVFECSVELQMGIESLQRWCLASMALVRQNLFASDVETRSSDPPCDVERFVETAAFLRMAESHGIKVKHTIADVTFFADADDLRQSLASTCPLDETSPVETLGLIHECLVTRRDHFPKGSTFRSSKSRKTNGVFYTPPQVIDYIIDRTVRPRLNSMNPEQVERLRVLDPAAGCGAFLIRVYRTLMDWHLHWFITNEPGRWPSDVERIERGWRLTFERRLSILHNNLFGVDLDPNAIEVARRILWLTLHDSSNASIGLETEIADWNSFESNLKSGHALVGPAFREVFSEVDFPSNAHRFAWADEFPQIANQGGFDIVLGNPPYRRERDFKRELDEIGVTPLGRYRSPRMDLWYYFVHRGIELLREGGTLSFITNAYWLNGTGAEKLIAVLRNEVCLDELFLLQDQPIFPGVAGRHQIFRLTKIQDESSTQIKILSEPQSASTQTLCLDSGSIQAFTKSRQQLFRNGRLDIRPSADRFLDRMNAFPRLMELGDVRQGIAENPSTINRRTIERFQGEPSAKDWVQGEGVFSLTLDELKKLALTACELELLRPYHDLCDLRRYWSAGVPSRWLIYSTRDTCPDLVNYPLIQRHLARFRAILDARRETRSGNNRWWHLHWPRDERIWRANKLVALQLALRPSFTPHFEPAYVSFSANVFVPQAHTREDLSYLCALLNSKVLWAWFEHCAKHRGIGLELNGHVLKQAPVRRIDFQNPDDVQCHDELIHMVDLRMNMEQSRVDRSSRDCEILNRISGLESRIDELVASLYGLQPPDLTLVNAITVEARQH